MTAWVSGDISLIGCKSVSLYMSLCYIIPKCYLDSHESFLLAYFILHAMNLLYLLGLKLFPLMHSAWLCAK